MKFIRLEINPANCCSYHHSIPNAVVSRRRAVHAQVVESARLKDSRLGSLSLIRFHHVCA